MHYRWHLHRVANITSIGHVSTRGKKICAWERQRCHRVLKLNHKLECRLMSHVNSFKVWQKGQKSATKRTGGPENNKKKSLNNDGDYDSKQNVVGKPKSLRENGVWGEPWSLSRNGMLAGHINNQNFILNHNAIKSWYGSIIVNICRKAFPLLTAQPVVNRLLDTIYFHQKAQVWKMFILVSSPTFLSMTVLTISLHVSSITCIINITSQNECFSKKNVLPRHNMVTTFKSPA